MSLSISTHFQVLCIHIYIYAVESKLGPKIAFFWVKTWSKFSSFFLCCVSKIFLLSAGRMRCFKTSEEKKDKNYPVLSQNLVQLCCATYLDQVLMQPWTKFWLNLFDICGPFFIFHNMLKPQFIVFSAKSAFFMPAPKQLGTLFVNTTVLVIFCPFFCIFVFFFAFLLCPVFCFLRGMKKDKIQNKTTKKKTTRCKQQEEPDNTDTKWNKSNV